MNYMHLHVAVLHLLCLSTKVIVSLDLVRPGLAPPLTIWTPCTDTEAEDN